MSSLWLSAADTFDPTGPFTQSAIETASFLLFKLSGEKYSGTRTSTDNFNKEYYDSMGLRTQPAVISGNMYNIPELDNGLRNLRLRNTPVLSIESIEFMGRTLDPTEYTLRNNAYIVRRGSLPWVLTTDSDLSVTYRHGTPPPRAGKQAAIRLANEFILLAMGSGACALPERISSVARQGISLTIMDSQEFISNGKVGIYEIDLFLAAVNPHKAKKKPKIFSVDRPRGERIN